MREPGTPRLLRAMNDRAALDLLLAHGPLSRPALGELTGLSKPTASQLLARLEAAGLVRADRQQPGPAGPQRAAVRGQPGGRLRRRPRRHTAADPRGRRRHHRPDGRRATSCRHRAGRPRHGRAGHRGRRRRVQATPASTATGCSGSSSARRAPSTPATRRLRYARHLPGWHAPRFSTSSARRWRSPVEDDNDVNLAAVAEQPRRRPRQRGLRAAVGRGGPRRRARDRRTAAPRLDRRRRRGRLPAGAGHTARAQGRRQQRGRVPGAGRRQGRARPGPRARHPRRHGRERGRGRRSARRRAGDAVLAELGHRLAIGLASIVAVLDPELVVLAGGVLSAGGERLRALVASGAARSRALPAPARAHRRRRTIRCCGARCTRAREPPATTSSTPPTRPRRPDRRRVTVQHTGPSDPDGAPPWRSRTQRSPVCAAAATVAALAGRLHRDPGTGGANDDPNADVTIKFWHGWSAPSEVEGHPGQRRRFREGAPQHPRQGRRQHHRRQDQPGAARRRGQRARRRLVLHHRQRRQVLLVGRVRRPGPVPEEGRHRPGGDLPEADCSTTPSSTATSARCRCSATRTGSTTTRTRSRRPASRPAEDLSEFEADAVKLTKPDGDSYSQLGFMPNYHGYETTTTHFVAQWDPTYFDADGKSTVASDPASPPCSPGRSTWSTPSAATTSWRSTVRPSATSSAPRTRSRPARWPCRSTASGGPA